MEIRCDSQRKPRHFLKDNCRNVYKLEISRTRAFAVVKFVCCRNNGLLYSKTRLTSYQQLGSRHSPSPSQPAVVILTDLESRVTSGGSKAIAKRTYATNNSPLPVEITEASWVKRHSFRMNLSQYKTLGTSSTTANFQYISLQALKHQSREKGNAFFWISSFSTTKKRFFRLFHHFSLVGVSRASSYTFFVTNIYMTIKHVIMKFVLRRGLKVEKTFFPPPPATFS